MSNGTDNKSIEQMVSQLIGMMKDLKQEVTSLKDEMGSFRAEVNERFDRVEKQQNDTAVRQSIQRSLIAENAEDIRILKEDVWQLRKNA